MRRMIFVGTMLLFCFSISWTFGAEQVSAQGPAGAGAAAAAQESSHSANPLNWVKKNSRTSSETPGNRRDIETKLTPTLQAQGVLAANVTATDACAPFMTLDGCLATLHASHNLGVDFNCLR